MLGGQERPCLPFLPASDWAASCGRVGAGVTGQTTFCSQPCLAQRPPLGALCPLVTSLSCRSETVAGSCPKARSQLLQHRGGGGSQLLPSDLKFIPGGRATKPFLSEGKTPSTLDPAGGAWPPGLWQGCGASACPSVPLGEKGSALKGLWLPAKGWRVGCDGETGRARSTFTYRHVGSLPLVTLTVSALNTRRVRLPEASVPSASSPAGSSTKSPPYE